MRNDMAERRSTMTNISSTHYLYQQQDIFEPAVFQNAAIDTNPSAWPQYELQILKLKTTPEIEEILREISTTDASLVIFCGAGISINSGLPSAIALLDKVLISLQVDLHDKDELIRPDWSLCMPFEVFFEIFLENTKEHQILNIFREGKPSTNHFFLVECKRKALTKEIYTTNFDLLIEQAFSQEHEELLVYKTEQTFTKADATTQSCKLIKVHGSIDDAESIRTTLSTIANRKLSTEREKIIDKIFGVPDAKRKVLVLGYSFSDIFDIVPRIEKIFAPKTKVFVIEHSNNIITKEQVVVESVSAREENNPLKKYDGKRVKVNTDSFIRWFWDRLDSSYNKAKDTTDVWSKYVDEWIKGFHSSYLKYTILGQLFYRVGNNTLSLKYHNKALEANEKGNKRGKGASYCNIGLIYHDLKNYDKAIENFLKAKYIFDEINFNYGIAAALTNLGYSYIYAPDKSKALLYLKKSLLISRNNDFKEKKLCESDALCNLGLLYEKLGDYANAIYYYSLTLDIDKEGNKMGEAQTLSDLGRIYKLQGNLKKALQLFKLSHDLALKLGMVALTEYTKEQAIALEGFLH